MWDGRSQREGKTPVLWVGRGLPPFPHTPRLTRTPHGPYRGGMPEPPALLSTDEAIQYLGQRGLRTSQDSLYRWAKRGAFPHSLQLPSRRWRFAPTDLDAVLSTARTTAAALES